MRLLFALPYVPSRIRVRPYHLIRELAEHHEVTVLAAAAGHEPLADLADLRRSCRSIEVVPVRLAASLWSCGRAALRGEPLQAAFCRSAELERRFVRLIAERSVDLVHVEHLRAAHLAALIPAELPRLYDSVDCISLLLRRTLRSSHSLAQRALAALELGRMGAYEARLLTRFDQVVATSPEDARALEALDARARVAVLPNGVDLEYFRPPAGAREAQTLIFTGKMSYHANVTAALHFATSIFPAVRRVHPAARLVIAGSGPPRSIQRLGRDPAITVTGYLPDLRRALARATVAVCPVTVKVGIQNKVLEALAMGLPVVSTSAGVAGLGVEPGRDLLVADDPAEFAEQVNRLLADPALGERIGRAGRRYVEVHHRWEAVAGRLESLYRDAIARRAAQVAGRATGAQIGGGERY